MKKEFKFTRLPVQKLACTYFFFGEKPAHIFKSH